jgi:hypothetical protein
MSEELPTKTRVVIAVTELTPLAKLWQEAQRHLRDPQADIVAVFVADDRWHRAASLPFTREISRISGAVADFTLQRANHLHNEAIDSARRQMHELASAAKLSCSFEVLSESDPQRIIEVVARPENVLIAPSLIARRPLFAALQEFGCRIVLIEPDEDAKQPR